MTCDIRFLVSGYGNPFETSISLIRADLSAGSFSVEQKFTGLHAPSYLSVHKTDQGTFLYTFEKSGREGKVLAFLLDEKGLQPLSEYQADFLGPCHISVSEKGDLVYAASYNNATVAVFGIQENGGLRFLSMQKHEGSGPNPDRQEQAHVHYAMERDGQLYVCDLGLDRVFIYDIHRPSGQLTLSDQSITLPAGSGPRHLIMDPVNRDRLYILSEMTASVFFCERSGGSWRVCQEISTLAGAPSDPALEIPAEASSISIGAAIRMSDDGRYLFASCRLGYQSITAFAVAEDGRLTFLDRAPSGGITPRDFGAAEDHLIIANQDSDNVTFLRFDRASGRLQSRPFTLTSVKPTCIALL